MQFLPQFAHLDKHRHQSYLERHSSHNRPCITIVAAAVTSPRGKSPRRAGTSGIAAIKARAGVRPVTLPAAVEQCVRQVRLRFRSVAPTPSPAHSAAMASIGGLRTFSIPGDDRITCKENRKFVRRPVWIREHNILFGVAN